ncbi:polysaccharide pyruvyl transferase GTB-type glycosyltransferase [Catovirus CTV1]|uniref:Polysaccharide pyruvyl transferase GTB-type glycosyltransferase n=1 Tax=Catovirus CTV1 TaxID=1977631 RepID=A0A1V0SAR6_9VIRU|nr:polysaccharide pyruvyl transferase GTB-type glycosyltransferase [Catovirus CTV1]
MDSAGKIQLRYHKCNQQNGNFGDEMSPVLVNKISKRDVINCASLNKPCLIAIGSYLQMAKDNDIIWGTGIRTIDQPCNYKNLRVKAVRGPITKKYLEKKKIFVPNVFGDPALLYTRLFDIQEDVNYLNKIGFIPHYTSLSTYQNNNKLPNNIKIISPLEKLDTVVSQIKTCNCVISSSLHGLIMADSFNIPNYWLYECHLNEGILKFEDYFASQNRQIKMHNSIENILKSSSEEYGNKINLNLLMDSFPRELIKL